MIDDSYMKFDNDYYDEDYDYYSNQDTDQYTKINQNNFIEDSESINFQNS